MEIKAEARVRAEIEQLEADEAALERPEPDFNLTREPVRQAQVDSALLQRRAARGLLRRSERRAAKVKF